MATSSGTAGHLYATGDNTLGFLDGQNHYMLKGVKDGAVELYHNNVKKFETHDVGTIFTEAGSGQTQAAIKVNTTLDTYGVITVRDKRDVDNAVSAFQVENASNGTNETNLLLRSVNLGSSAFSHGIYAAKSHRFAVSSNVTPTVQVDSDGLKFNNDQAAANALNDYEEGTWTPVWAAGGGSSGLANIANCEYVKIGELVHVRGEFSLTGGSSNVSTTDGWYITGLPFPNSDSSGSAGTWWMSSSWTSGTRATGLVMSYGTNILYFGTEYASGMGRLANIRHFACTYRTN